jgi:predicted ATPase
VHPAEAIPHRLTTFVGREAELAELDQLLSANRIVTLVGIGGSGKTSLAVTLAARWASEGTQVVFGDLVSAKNGFDVVSAACQAAGVVAPSEGAGLRRLARVLEKRRSLLVLDNAEQIRPDVAALVGALAHVSELRVCITSRVALDRAWECVWQVPPMSESDAETLLQARLRTGVQDDQSIAICRAADGLPLAIELLAAQCDAVGVSAVIERLADLDVLLARTDRDRHSSVRRILQSTCDALSLPAQRLLTWLSEFRGGFAREHLDSLGEALQDDATIRVRELLLSGLVVRSIPDRYLMLEPVRQFAELTLEERGESTAAQRALVEWSVQFLRSKAWGFLDADNRSWRRSLDIEAANTEAAFDAAVALDDGAAVIDLLIGLSYYWSRHRPVIGKTHARVAERFVPDQLAHPRYASARLALATLDSDLERAQQLRREALDGFRAAGDGRGETLAMFQIAQDAGSVEVVDEALELTNRVGADFFTGWLLVRKAALLHRDGHSEDEVLTALSAAEDVARRTESRQLLTGVLLGRSGFRLASERAEEDVLADLDEAIALVEESGDPGLLIEARCLRVAYTLIRGDLHRALLESHDAVRVCDLWFTNEVVTDPMRIARVIAVAVSALRTAGHPAAAREVLTCSGNLSEAMHSTVHLGERYPLPPQITNVMPAGAPDANLDTLAEALTRLREELEAIVRTAD